MIKLTSMGFRGKWLYPIVVLLPEIPFSISDYCVCGVCGVSFIDQRRERMCSDHHSIQVCRYWALALSAGKCIMGRILQTMVYGSWGEWMEQEFWFPVHL